jgi:hypothetical protein
MRLLLLGAGVLVLASAHGLAAEDSTAVLVQGAGATRTVTCADVDARVEGSRNTITFTGHCTGLQLRGDGNVVSVPLAGPALIDIEGNHNRVRYTSTPDALPRLRVAGSFNELTPSPYAVAPRAEAAAISGDGLNLELDCAGKPYTMQSVHSHLHLRGACPALTLRGEANLVEAELAPGAEVTIAGNAISLLYRVAGDGAAPKVALNGMGSIALPEASMAGVLAQPVGAARLPVPLLMQLLGAQVQAQGTLVHLPAAVFSPNGYSPAGEVTLQRLAGLIVQAWPSGVKIAGHNPDALGAKQIASGVSEYLVGHGVPGLSAEITGDTTGEPSVDVWLLK